jgi:hypothetical protein
MPPHHILPSADFIYTKIPEWLLNEQLLGSSLQWLWRPKMSLY